MGRRQLPEMETVRHGGAGQIVPGDVEAEHGFELTPRSRVNVEVTECCCAPKEERREENFIFREPTGRR